MRKYAEIIKRCFRKKNVGAFLAVHNERFRVGDVARMIYAAYLPMDEKLELYRQFVDLTDTGPDKEHAEVIYKLMKHSYETFLNPKVPAVYISTVFENTEMECTDLADQLETKSNMDEISGSLEMLLSKIISDYRSDYYGSFNQPVIKITQVLIPEAGVAHETMNVSYAMFNGTWLPFMIEPTTRWLLKTDVYIKYAKGWNQDDAVGWSCDVMDYVSAYGFGPMHYRFPYEQGTEMQLQTPIMKEPVYGYLHGDQDSHGCWYYFLDEEKEWPTTTAGIDLGYHIIQSGLWVYVALDWLEPVG